MGSNFHPFIRVTANFWPLFRNLTFAVLLDAMVPFRIDPWGNFPISLRSSPTLAAARKSKSEDGETSDINFEVVLRARHLRQSDPSLEPISTRLGSLRRNRQKQLSTLQT
ncbi:hypothetical protein Zmor_003054 [Zophobas morio]|uniref:Uncharacterized protein n=1 Tax=Zophobas morio TaxID=2755281 RepID=A0AA38M0Y7_9CUCU|nr:hypothetical protein Zmor_003054 [Zophobas morio]